MIDELISTDLAALAAHDRQHIGPLALPQAETASPPRFALPWQAALTSAVVALVATAGAWIASTLRVDDAYVFSNPIWFWETPRGVDPWILEALVVALTAVGFLVASRRLVRRDPAAALASATGAAWAGATAASICAVVGGLMIRHVDQRYFYSPSEALYRFMQPGVIAAVLAAAILGAAALGSTWRGRVPRASTTWLPVVQILAASSLLVMFGLVWFSWDGAGWRELIEPWPPAQGFPGQWSEQVFIVHDVVGGPLIGIFGAVIVIGIELQRERAGYRSRWLRALEHWLATLVAIAVGGAAFALRCSRVSDYPLDHGQRTTLAVLGTIAVTLLVVSWSLRQRRSTLEQLSVVVTARPTSTRAFRLGTALPIAAVIATLCVLLRSRHPTFEIAPQLALSLVLAVVAMVGFVGSSALKRHRPLADLIAAGLVGVTAVASSVIGWNEHMTDCGFFSPDGVTAGPCQVDPNVTRLEFILCAWAAILVIAAVAARFLRRVGPPAWSVPAKIVVVTVVLTWVGVSQYRDRWMNLIDFHSARSTLATMQVAPHQIWVSRQGVFSGGMIRAWAHPGQWNALEAGIVLLALAISIGIATTREKLRPSRWLAILESRATIPLGVIVATGGLVLASAQWVLFEVHRGDPDDIPWFAAWSTVGAVVAYASMLLRRRRREALS